MSKKRNNPNAFTSFEDLLKLQKKEPEQNVSTPLAEEISNDTKSHHEKIKNLLDDTKDNISSSQQVLPTVSIQFETPNGKQLDWQDKIEETLIKERLTQDSVGDINVGDMVLPVFVDKQGQPFAIMGIDAFIHLDHAPQYNDSPIALRVYTGESKQDFSTVKGSSYDGNRREYDTYSSEIHSYFLVKPNEDFNTQKNNLQREYYYLLLPHLKDRPSEFDETSTDSKKVPFKIGTNPINGEDIVIYATYQALAGSEERGDELGLAPYFKWEIEESAADENVQSVQNYLAGWEKSIPLTLDQLKKMKKTVFTGEMRCEEKTVEQFRRPPKTIVSYYFKTKIPADLQHITPSFDQYQNTWERDYSLIDTIEMEHEFLLSGSDYQTGKVQMRIVENRGHLMLEVYNPDEDN